MTIHLLRLAAGVSSLDHLQEILAAIRPQALARGLPPCFFETRSIPRRREELLDGGCLYRVIRGQIMLRQKITDIEVVELPDERPFARVSLDEELILTRPDPRRAFQGWRYLKPEDVPPDLDAAGEGDEAEMPAAMRQELEKLGLL